MKKQLIMLFTALLVLFTALPAAQFEAAEVTAQQEFELPFEILQDVSDEKSVTDQYVQDKAKIVVEDGKTFAYVTLTNTDWWQSLKVQTTQPGTFTDKNFVDAEVVSEDVAAKTKIVKFQVQDLSKVLNAKIHIIVTGVPGLGAYDNNYDIRMKFDSSKIPGVLKDGAYTIDYKALHADEDKASSMARFMETPASLTVKDGKKVVELTLTNNEQITAFQVEQGKEFVDATVVKTDVAANKRVVSFEVADFSKVVNAKATVFVAAANHTGNYDFRLSFDETSIQAVKAPVEVKFEDIKGTGFETYIEALAAKEIVKGTTPTTFSPGNNLTRAQFAIILARALELPKAEYQGTFSDVPKNLDWAVSEIEAAAKAGITTGSNGKFRPYEFISREQMATMIIRAIEYKDASILEGVTTDVKFADAASISDYAKANVDYAAGLGIIGGKTIDGKKVFDPKASATRGQASKMVYYLLENLEK